MGTCSCGRCVCNLNTYFSGPTCEDCPVSTKQSSSSQNIHSNFLKNNKHFLKNIRKNVQKWTNENFRRIKIFHLKIEISEVYFLQSLQKLLPTNLQNIYSRKNSNEVAKYRFLKNSKIFLKNFGKCWDKETVNIYRRIIFFESTNV